MDDSTDSTEAATTTTSTTTNTTLPRRARPANDEFVEIAFGVDLVADVAKATGVVWVDDDGDDEAEAMYIQHPARPDLSGRQRRGAHDGPRPHTRHVQGPARFGTRGARHRDRPSRWPHVHQLTPTSTTTPVFVSYELVDGVADPDSRREVLFIEQPGVGHNGGRLYFDDDGKTC